MKKIAGSLKLELAQYREIKDFIKFGSDLDASTLKLIEKGRLLTLLLNQDKFSPVSIEEQVLMLYAGLNDYLLDIKNSKELKIFFGNLMKMIDESILFKTHFNLLRIDSYYEFFGQAFFKVIFESKCEQRVIIGLITTTSYK